MGDWYETFNDIFWISISATVFGFLGITVKNIMKSKCDQTSLCWGLISIHRRVELEVDDSNSIPANSRV